MISLFGKVESSVMKGKNAGYQHINVVYSIFSFSHSVFQSFLVG